MKKCLTFRWSKAKLDGKIVDDNGYTYCPKKGFMKILVAVKRVIDYNVQIRVKESLEFIRTM